MADPPVGDPGGDPTNSHQVVLLSPSPPPELRRITRGYLKRQRNSLNSFTATNKAPTFEFTGRNDENGANLDDVIGLIADLKKSSSNKVTPLKT
jgi:hypothetical protein